MNDGIHVMLTDGLGWPRLLWQSISWDATSGQDGRRRNAFHWLLLSKCHMLSMYVHCRLSLVSFCCIFTRASEKSYLCPLGQVLMENGRVACLNWTYKQFFSHFFTNIHQNCCHQSCSFWLKYAPYRFSAGALPQTPLVSLQHSPRTPSCFMGQGGAPRKGEKEEKGKEKREGTVSYTHLTLPTNREV